MPDPIDLDHGARLSSAASSGDFVMHAVPVGAPPSPRDPDHPAPNCWLEFGRDIEGNSITGHDVSVRVAVNGDDESLRTSRGAMADGALVAWLLTHRDELIRLARLGREAEVRRG